MGVLSSDETWTRPAGSAGGRLKAGQDWEGLGPPWLERADTSHWLWAQHIQGKWRAWGGGGQ